MHFNFWHQNQIPRFIISPKPLPLLSGSSVVNLVYDEEDPVLFLKRQLQIGAHTRGLLFGGGKINGWFYKHNVVDELHLTLAPLIIGQALAPYLMTPELNNPIKFCLLTSHCEENFVFLKYRVLKP